MKQICHILFAIIALPFLLACGKNDPSPLAGDTIEINGVKCPQSMIELEGYWSDKSGHGELTVSVQQRDERYPNDDEETTYYTFIFDSLKCPKEGDNLAKMNLKLEVEFYQYKCSYESGDLIVKSTFNKKKEQIRVQFSNLKMSNKDKTKEYLFNGAITVPFDYFRADYYD